MDEQARSNGSGLYSSLAPPYTANCDCILASGQVRPEWEAILGPLNALGEPEVRQLQERIRRMRHEDGATYNPFDDPGAQESSWALDLIPYPLDESRWAELEAGLQQRVRLLDRILADVYGTGQLLRDGHLPPEMVFPNPGFLRACHGIAPKGGRHLTLYAADLYQTREGTFRVLREFGGTPTGLGYALENRIVSSRVLSQLYQSSQVLRVAPFFKAFHRGITERSGLHRGDPDIVFLTSGPDCRMYFEHALLSRYLGYTLVESQDLTVRNGVVFLKKLAGLEPVEAILRAIPDRSSDPFALRQSTMVGVAGLVQACRDQSVQVVNPIGGGFIDTPLLQTILPALCTLLEGEDLQLQSHPRWWCGSGAGLDHALANLETLEIHPVSNQFPRVAQPGDARTAIAGAPWAYFAQEAVQPATVPVWTGDMMEYRPFLLRVFVSATGNGYTVMPGGLAMTGPDCHTLVAGTPEQQLSKDVWVFSQQPVLPVSLMGGLQNIPQFSRSIDLPSRVADNLLWLGRYLERSEGRVRLLQILLRRLSGEAQPEEIPELGLLVRMLPDQVLLDADAASGDDDPDTLNIDERIHACLFDREMAQSVISGLQRVQETARKVRDRLSRNCWRVINRLEFFSSSSGQDPLELLDDTLFSLSAFSGLAMESMTRGLGWRFMDMGRRMERALRQVQLVRAALPLLCSDSDGNLETLLEVGDSLMTYRARYRTSLQLAPTLDLLLADETNPNALAFQLNQISEHVAHLPRLGMRRYASREECLSLEMLTRVRLLDLTTVHCEDAEAPMAGLDAFLSSTQDGLQQFSQEIIAHYLSRVPATPHFSSITSHPGV